MHLEPPNPYTRPLLPNADMDVLPGRLLFAQDTIDMAKTAFRAVQAMGFF